MSVSLANSGVVLVKGTQLKTKPETVHHQVGGGFKSTAVREEFPTHLALSGKPQSPSKSKERPVSMRKEETQTQLTQNRHKASPPPSPRPVKSSHDLETEYIHNLQQQVYLLETELKIVREKGASSTGGAAGGSFAARIGNDSSSVEDENTLPLQDILGQLRHRVRVQQTKLEQAMTAAEDAAAEFRSQRATLTLSIDNLEADKSDLIRHLEDMQALHVADKERLAAQIIQLQRDSRALQMTVDKNSATEQRLNVERDELVQKNCLFERSVADALRREKEARSLLSVSEESCAEALSSVERLKIRLHSAENDLVRFQSYVPAAVADKLREQLRSAEMNLSNERTRATRLESDVNALRGRNEALQAELAEVREVARDAEKAFMKERETWNRDALQEQLVQLRVDHSKAKSDASKLEARLQARAAEIDELHGQLADRQSRLIAASSVARQQTESAEVEMREMVGLRKECGKLSEENMRLSSQIEGLIRSQTERESKLSKLLREHAVAVTEAESCRRRLEKAKMLEQINPAQFEGLMQTNMQVAQHIRSLMDHMETGSSTVPVPQQQQQQQQQKQQEREEEQQQHQERYSQGAHGDAFAPSRSKPLVSGLSARDAAIAVQKQDAAGISAQIRRVGRRLFEALDYLDNDRSGLVSVGELLSELEGLGINATAAQLQLPQDETANVNYAEFLRLHSKR